MTRFIRLLFAVLLALPVASLGQETRGEAKPAASAATPTSDSVRAGAGTLDPRHIQEVLQQQRSRIRACYEVAQVKNPALEGAVTFQFVIASTGRVESVSVQASSLESASVIDCISERIAGLRFAAPTGGSVIVNYPFRFRAG